MMFSIVVAVEVAFEELLIDFDVVETGIQVAQREKKIRSLPICEQISIQLTIKHQQRRLTLKYWPVSWLSLSLVEFEVFLHSNIPRNLAVGLDFSCAL